MISTGKSIPYILKTPIKLPLDGVPLANIIRANGTIQLLTDYLGALVNVQDETIKTPTDISPVDGLITSSSVLSVGSNVETLRIYDQSGNGIDFTQANTSYMPYLAQSGTVKANANGIIGTAKPSGSAGMRMTTATASVPKDFTHIAVFSSAANNFTGNYGGNFGLNKYISIVGASSDKHFFRSYGSTNTSEIRSYGSIDLTNGVVCTMAHNDTAGDFDTWLNTDLVSTSVSAGRRSASTVAQDWQRAFAVNPSTEYVCHVDIMIDGTEYAELITNRLINIFNP